MLSFVAAGPASAKAPCWKQLINDWYDGRIDNTYPIHCYEEAIDHLPSDVEAYSSAAEDIRRALQKRIADEKRAKTKKSHNPPPAPPATTNSSGGGKGKNPKPSPKPTPSTGPAKTTPTPTTSPGREKGGGPIGHTIRNIGPKNADSVPIPLLVLGGIAVLLLAAGSAGLIARRIQARRVPIRPSGSTPPQS